MLIQSFRITAFLLFIIASFYFVYLGEFLPALITIIAGTSYLGMYLKNTGNILAYRYSDWAFTTPIILFILLTKINIPIDQVILIMGLDVLMILTGYLGQVEPDVNKRLTWYIFGVLLFIPIVYYLAKALKTSKAAVLTLIVWILYPIIWILKDYNVIKTESYALAVMDVIAKIGFGLLLHFDK